MQKAFNARGVNAKGSISKSDNNIYFYAPEGFKVFSGISVQEGKTEFDSISTDTIDRRIRSEVDKISDRTSFKCIAFKDRYYVSDTLDRMFVLDEKTGGWSTVDTIAPEVFLKEGNDLYVGKDNKFYKFNSDSTADVSSAIKTKDFMLSADLLYKIFEKLVLYFRTDTSSNDITVTWYIDGSTGASGTLTETIPASAITWDGSYSWDGTLTWNNVTVIFKKFVRRKLKSGVTISIGISATGTNRFFFSSMSLLYELMRREVS